MKKLTESYVKKEYSRQLREEYSDYEFERWFSTRGEWEGYRMQYLAQRFHTKNIKFRNYFEFGSGPGTWTRMFLDNDRQFTLLDLSEEMIKQAKINLGIRKNIDYAVGSVLGLKKHDAYDFIFSSRTIKYVPNKRKMLQNLYNSLKPDGTCVIINQSMDTVMQRLLRIFRGKGDLLHSEGITIHELRMMLESAGFRDISFYPVSIKVGIPGIKIFHWISRRIWNHFYKKKMNTISTLLSGSYLVKMKK